MRAVTSPMQPQVTPYLSKRGSRRWVLPLGEDLQATESYKDTERESVVRCIVYRGNKHKLHFSNMLKKGISQQLVSYYMKERGERGRNLHRRTKDKFLVESVISSTISTMCNQGDGILGARLSTRILTFPSIRKLIGPYTKRWKRNKHSPLLVPGRY